MKSSQPLLNRLTGSWLVVPILVNSIPPFYRKIVFVQNEFPTLLVRHKMDTIKHGDRTLTIAEYKIVIAKERKMDVPSSLLPVYEKLSAEAQVSVRRDYSRRKKSMVFAYLAWFFFGWHYLYLRRVGLQFAFWLTLGGCGIWWFIDLFRVAGMVNRLNEDTARELMVQYKSLSL